MYLNNYEINFKYQKKEKKILENDKFIATVSKNQFNQYFANVKKVDNRKYIREIIFGEDYMTIKFETEKTLPNKKRRGNALRLFSIYLAKNGMQDYVINQRLLKSA